ncbi:MAG: hypothetical protein NTZ44_00180 [Candidatus Nomurabacteria bacterium]|nr:hypothetical protein [Candidatus Nomurabacteria bacterium]
MKNIIKKSIAFLAVVVLLGLNINTASAAPATQASTLAAINVTGTSMTLRGNYTTNAISTGIINTWFEYGNNYNTVLNGGGTTLNYSSPATSFGSFQANLTGLTPGNTYYFRAVVSQNGSIGYGDPLSQMTTPSVQITAAASTLAATNVTGTSMTLRGNYTTTGTGIINTWFEYGNNYNTVLNGGGTTLNYASPTSSSGSFQANFTGLTAGNTYYFRAVVSIGGLIRHGDTLSQMTTAATSTVPTLTDISPASGISGNTYPITLTGTNFGTNPNVSFSSGITVSAITVNTTGTSITLTIVISNTTVGAHDVTVTNGSQVSNIKTFTVNAPASNTCATTTPTISSISPSSVTAGAGTTNLTVNATNLTNGTSIVLFNGSSRTTTTNGNVATATLNSSDTASAGSYTITVTNGTNCVSNGKTFTVNSSGGGGGGGGGGAYYTYPSISTVSSSVNGSTVTINGSMNPNYNTATSWFEYSTDSSTVSSGNGIQTTHNAQGSGSATINFSASLSLSSNTTYYFRAVANNSYGTVYGNILSFTTSVTSNNQLAVTTVAATDKTNNFARLNGVATTQNGLSTKGYFEYGTSASLGNTTTQQNLGNTDGVVNFSDTISGLTIDTIYYFRAVALNQNNTVRGEIFVFQTGVTPTSTPVNTGPKVSTAKSSILTITTKTDNVSIGDKVEYLVVLKNTTTSNFENVIVNVQLPKEIAFDESNFGKKGLNNEVVLNADTMVPNQTSSMTIKGHVVSKTTSQDVVITTATMTYNVAGSTTQKDEIAYVTNHISDNSNLTAASIFGANFLPKTLIGWLLLLLVAFGLVVVGKRLFVGSLFKRATNQSSHDDHMHA